MNMAEATSSTPATPDNSVLAGGNAPAAPISAAELPGVPAVTPAAPLASPMGDVSLPTTTGPGTPTATAPAPHNPRPWLSILQGALDGLTGVKKEGRGGFGVGLAQGAGAEIEQAQRRAQAQSQIKFQSAQSANLVAEAAYRNQQLHQMGQEFEDVHNKNAMDIMKDLQVNGIPFKAIGRDQASVNAFLTDATSKNNGVPPYSVLHVGDQFIAIDLNQISQGNQMLPIINHYERMTGQLGADGQPMTTAALLSQMPQQAKNSLFDTAVHYKNPVVRTQGELDDAMNRASILEKVPDYPGKADDLKALNSVIDTAKKTISQTASEAETRRLETGPLNESDARTITTAKVGQFSSDRVRQAKEWLQTNEAEKTRIYGTEHPEEQKLTNQADPFGNPIGNTAIQTQKDYKTAVTAYNKDYAKDLNQLDQSRSQLSGIISNAEKTGKLPGADAVVGIFDAVGLSSAPLKGRGFRINNQVLSEHVEGTRNAWQSMALKLSRLTPEGTGQIVSLKQLQDYERIMDQAHHDAYVGAANDAVNRGIGIQNVPRGNGKPVDNNTLDIFLTLSKGDANKASRLLKQYDWAPPQQ
jgi:hypothetical protein